MVSKLHLAHGKFIAQFEYRNALRLSYQLCFQQKSQFTKLFRTLISYTQSLISTNHQQLFIAFTPQQYLSKQIVKFQTVQYFFRGEKNHGKNMQDFIALFHWLIRTDYFIENATGMMISYYCHISEFQSWFYCTTKLQHLCIYFM